MSELRLPRLLVAALLVAALAGAWAVGFVVATPAAATVDPTGTAARELAERYSPVVVVREYPELCSGDGEPYVPMTVDAVLGNPEVALRQVGNGDQVIRWAPTAADLADRGPGVYLDFAGDSLKPGCVFAQDSARYTPIDRSAIYAHVVQQPDRPGFVAVQYWLYWYYNDWNDKHESDWEFVQVLFRASSVEEALATSPVSMGYAQHTGGEVSLWSDDKLTRDGTHPFVYSSERSHASYVEPALFLGRGASEGFGCDNTQAPSTELRPRVVLLPDAASGPDDPFAWLGFEGRWGERQASPNDGPTGPASKPRWTAPVDWQDGLRASSFVVPGGSEAAPPIIESFCTVVGAGSVLFIEFVASPAKVLAVLVAIGLMVAFLLRRTSWRRVPALPVVSRRRAGELVRGSARLYRARPLAFVIAGAPAVPIGLLAALVTLALQQLPYVGTAATVTESGEGGRVVVASAVAAAFWPLTVLVIGAVVAGLLDGAATPADVTPARALAALHLVRSRTTALVLPFLLTVVAVDLLSVTVVGLPVAAWLAVRFAFLPQVTMLEGLRGVPALRRSGALVRGRMLHTAVVAALALLAASATGVLLGLLLLIAFTGLPLWVVSATALACQVALVPLAATVLTLLYGDASASIEQPAGAVTEEALA
jgi:hypothetical protein